MMEVDIFELFVSADTPVISYSERLLSIQKMDFHVG
jgi:hypothetical protein